MRRSTLLASALTLAACAPDVGGYRPLRAGDPVPEYGAPVVGGDTLHLEQLRGSPVMLNIWATWCPPCREEMPGLQELHATYADRGLRVLAVSVDARGAEAAVREFMQDFGLTFTILHDPAERVSRQFRTTGVPETFLIDADGVVVHRWIGRFDPLAPDVIERVEALLPQ